MVQITTCCRLFSDKNCNYFTTYVYCVYPTMWSPKFCLKDQYLAHRLWGWPLSRPADNVTISYHSLYEYINTLSHYINQPYFVIVHKQEICCPSSCIFKITDLQLLKPSSNFVKQLSWKTDDFFFTVYNLLWNDDQNKFSWFGSHAKQNLNIIFPRVWVKISFKTCSPNFVGSVMVLIVW